MLSASYFLILLLAEVRMQEVTTPSSLLGPRNFNHHSSDARYYFRNLGLNEPEPTKQGPVLFPNDGPSPPKTPLIVTSRPLLESIEKSELNPSNNTVAEQSQISRVTFNPGFDGSDGDLYDFTPQENGGFGYDYRGDTPYADVVRKARLQGFGADRRFNDYEERTILPPIYKALYNHAKQNVLKTKKKDPPIFGYEVREPAQDKDYQDNELHDYDSNSDQAKNYAFSYAVKDHKTGDDFSHSQQSSGSATNGEYRVRLPDGRMQIVSYTADENGYKADVRYDEDVKNVINNDYDSRYNGNEHNFNNNGYNVPNSHSNNGHNDINNNDILQNPQNPVAEKFYKVSSNDYYPDVSQEYNNDYSLEYDGINDNYAPHKSKFTNFADNNANLNVIPKTKLNYATGSTVRPSYDEIKYLFVPKKTYNAQAQSTNNYLNAELPVGIDSPSTTQSSLDYNTEKVVVIAPTKLYTDIRSSIPKIAVTPSPSSYYNAVDFASTTPSYPLSSLQNNVNLSGLKPVFSESYLNRLNKYLIYK